MQVIHVKPCVRYIYQFSSGDFIATTTQSSDSILVPGMGVQILLKNNIFKEYIIKQVTFVIIEGSTSSMYVVELEEAAKSTFNAEYLRKQVIE